MYFFGIVNNHVYTKIFAVHPFVLISIIYIYIEREREIFILKYSQFIPLC
jgi:hypothetical protein